jgi:hypothetical protein
MYAELGSGAGYLGRADAFCVSTLSSMRALWPILPSETNYGRLRPRPKENCPLRMRWASSMPAIVMAAIAAKQKVDGLAVFVDCPNKGNATSHLYRDIRLIHPRASDRPYHASRSNQLRRRFRTLAEKYIAARVLL